MLLIDLERRRGAVSKLRRDSVIESTADSGRRETLGEAMNKRTNVIARRNVRFCHCKVVLQAVTLLTIIILSGKLYYYRA